MAATKKARTARSSLDVAGNNVGGESRDVTNRSGATRATRRYKSPENRGTFRSDKQKRKSFDFLFDRLFFRADYLLSFSRISTRRILPDMVLGISSTNSIMRGYL